MFNMDSSTKLYKHTDLIHINFMMPRDVIIAMCLLTLMICCIILIETEKVKEKTSSREI